jgi:hypothetical protein
VLRVTSALAPGAIGLVSKVPPRSVAVWGRWPVLDQVTFVPAATVSRRGEKSKSTMLASPPSWAAAGAPDGGGPGRGGDQDQAGQGEQGQQAEGAHSATSR